MNDLPDASPGSVRAVSRALRLLLFLGPDRTEATLMEFVEASGLATSTVQRLLQTLEREHFLRRDRYGRYTFGTALMQLGLASQQSIELYDLAKPLLDELSQSTGETANLALLNGHGEAFYLRQRLSDKAIRHANWLGRPFLPAGTAVGAALLGKVGTTGVFTTRKTQEPDVTAVGAPVHNADGIIVAGLSATGPTFRISDQQLKDIEMRVIDAASELTRQLGGRWPYSSD